MDGIIEEENKRQLIKETKEISPTNSKTSNHSNHSSTENNNNPQLTNFPITHLTPLNPICNFKKEDILFDNKDKDVISDSSDYEILKKIQCDSTSVFTTSSEGTEGSDNSSSIGSHNKLKKYESAADYYNNQINFKRSKSSKYKKPKSNSAFQPFAVVKEEKYEDDLELNKITKPKFKKMFTEMYDNLEDGLLIDNLSRYNPRNAKLTKSLSLMAQYGAVVEVKEEIDFNHIRMKPFAKFQISDNFIKDDNKKNSTANLRHMNYELEEEQRIEEDINMEDEQEVVIEKRKTKSISRIQKSLPKSDLIEELDEEKNPNQLNIKNIITEEIKEMPDDDGENQEVRIGNSNKISKCILLLLFYYYYYYI